MQIPPEVFVAIKRKAAEILGGEERLRQLAAEESAAVQAVWDQNTEAIGRILRAHLFVEHYLTEFLAKEHPGLGSLQEARLTFAQKVALLDGEDVEINEVLPGLRRLNSIRNKLAHRLDALVTDDDAKVFQSSTIFSEQLAQKQSRKKVGTSPIDVLEAFAKHTSIVFTHRHSEVGRAMVAAIEGLLPRSRGDA